jgi:hypothetical protein
MNRFASLLAIAALAAAATSAWGHAVLKSSAPAADESVSGPVGNLRLSFNEPLEPAFSRVQLTDSRNSPVPIGDVTSADRDARTIIVVLKGTLSPGKYVVQWSAMGHDGHRTKGRFAFVVK